MGPARLLLAKVYADAVSLQLVHAICGAADGQAACTPAVLAAMLMAGKCSLQADWPGH